MWKNKFERILGENVAKFYPQALLEWNDMVAKYQEVIEKLLMETFENERKRVERDVETNRHCLALLK